jgi:gas vesicle protein
VIEFGYFFLGALIGVVGGLFFYQQSGRELRREAANLRDKSEELRKLHELTLFALTNPQSKLDLKRDDKGNVVGIVVQIGATTNIRFTAKAGLTITENPD